MDRRRCLSIFLIVLLPFLAAGQEPPAKPVAPKKSVEQLIAQLGSEQFDEREVATRELKDREDALPALRKAVQSSDVEVRRRAALLLEGWREKLVREELRKLLARCKGGEADSFIEQMTTLKGAVKEETWQAALDLVGVVVKTSGVQGDNFRIPGAELMRHRATTDGDRGGAMVVHERLIADKVTIDAHIVHAAVVCAGPVKTGSHLVGGIVFANGDVKIGSHVVGGLIICDGDVEIDSHVVASVILARGKVTVRSAVRESVIKQNEPNPLGVVTFFDPVALGVEVAPGVGGLEVQAAPDGKRFAKAGLRKGDLVLTVNGMRVDSAEIFRRRLRRAALEDRGATLQVRRGDKTLELTVRLGD
jgi:hypothetical protein